MIQYSEVLDQVGRAAAILARSAIAKVEAEGRHLDRGQRVEFVTAFTAKKAIMFLVTTFGEDIDEMGLEVLVAASQRSIAEVVREWQAREEQSHG